MGYSFDCYMNNSYRGLYSLRASCRANGSDDDDAGGWDSVECKLYGGLVPPLLAIRLLAPVYSSLLD